MFGTILWPRFSTYPGKFHMLCVTDRIGKVLESSTQFLKILGTVQRPSSSSSTSKAAAAALLLFDQPPNEKHQTLLKYLAQMQSASIVTASDANSPRISAPRTTPQLRKKQLQSQQGSGIKMRSLLSETQSASIDESSDNSISAFSPAASASAQSSPTMHVQPNGVGGQRTSPAVSRELSDWDDDAVSLQVTIGVWHA